MTWNDRPVKKRMATGALLNPCQRAVRSVALCDRYRDTAVANVEAPACRQRSGQEGPLECESERGEGEAGDERRTKTTMIERSVENAGRNAPERSQMNSPSRK